MRNRKDVLKKLANNMSLLIVDDEEFITELTADMLKRIFQKIDTAKDGVEALELYKQKSYDIVITDISMPNMNGIELTEKIKEIHPNQEIIVISAHSDAEYLLDLINKNISHFVPKPINANLIEALIKICEVIYNKNLVKKYNDYLKGDRRFARRNILLSVTNEKITNLLSRQTYEIHNAPPENIVSTAVEDLPNIIILDEKVANLEKLIEEILLQDKIKYVPIVVIAYEDSKPLYKNLLNLGVHDIVFSKNGAESFVQTIGEILRSRRNFNSGSFKFIRHFSEFQKTVKIANKMKIVATTLGTYFNLSPSKIFDIRNTLTLLSTTYGEIDKKELLRFFNNLNNEKQISTLYQSMESGKTLEANIIKAIYYIIKQKVTGINNEDLEKLNEIDSEVLKKALEFSKQNTLLLNNTKDVIGAGEILEELINKNKYLDFNIEVFIERFKNVLYDFILAKIDILVNVKIHDTYLDIFLEPQEECKTIVSIIENTEFQKAVEISFENNQIIFTLGKKIPEVEKEDEPVFITIDSFENREDKIEDKEIISAQNFMTRLVEEDQNLDLLDELAELEEDFEDTIATSNLTNSGLEIVAVIISKYARFIDSLYEFEEVSLALNNFAEHLKTFGEDEQNVVDQKVVVFLEAIKNDLKSWREGIFLYKTVDDIHFLDASFISNSQQIEMFLAPTADFEDTDDLFF